MSSFKELSEFINEQLRRGPARIQKVYSSPHFLNFQIRFFQKTEWLYLGRGGRYQGIFFEDAPLSSSMRIQDRLLDWMRANLDGLMLTKTSAPTDENYLVFYFEKKNQELAFHLAYGKEGLSFVLVEPGDNFSLFYRSWLGITQKLMEDADPYKEMKELELLSLSISSDKEIGSKKNYESLVEGSLKKVSTKKRKKNEATYSKILGDIERLVAQEALKEELPRITDEQTLKGFALKLGIKNADKQTFYDLRDQIYRKVKKIKIAVTIQRGRAETLFLKLKTEDGKERLEESPIMPVKSKVSLKERAARIGEFDCYRLTSGKIIAIGKNRVGNNELLTKFAKGDDLWFHLEDRPSSHLIFKGSEAELRDEDWSVMASMIADASGYNDNRISLVYCKRKDVKLVKGESGQVTLKHKKVRTVDYFSRWKEIVAPH